MERMDRQEVYKMVDTEREYQIESWGDIDTHGHEVGAWITLMHRYLALAEEAWVHNSGDVAALEQIRKVIGIGVACAEQHGLTARAKSIGFFG